jgi:hypothetical protein
MKTKSPFRNKSQYKGSKFSKILDNRSINKISKITGYKKRNSGKVSARNLIISFMMMVSKKMNTYENWAQEVSLGAIESVSKQAIEERMCPETTAMIKMVLEKELQKNLLARARLKDQSQSKFNSINIEDSTIFNLPAELSFAFPGNVSRGQKKSQIKIHALYDLTQNIFQFIDLHSFTRNDQSLSAHVLKYIKPGDLLLRDMGFLVLDVLEQIDIQGAFFISRKRSQIMVFDTDTEKEIALLKQLRKKKFLDNIVLVGRKKKMKVRLVIIPLPPNQASEKRRKARKDRDKRLNHNKDYYELLGYSIFITNIPQSCCQTEEIKKLYGLRWQIEIIFKSWKSCFSIEKLIPLKCNNPNRIYCMIYLWLLYIFLFQVVWIIYCKKHQNNEVNLSLLKMAKFFSVHFGLIFTCKNEQFFDHLLLSKCRYDKRIDRLNMSQKYNKIAA